MAQRHLNWKLAIVIVICLAMSAVTIFGLRAWQRNRLARAAREAGLKAYDNRTWDNAANNLGRYLRFDPTNVEILLKFAEAQLNLRPVNHNSIQRAIAAYRNILRIDNKNAEAARRLVGLYLRINIPTEAELIAERYLQINEDPEIHRMLAISLARQRKFTEATAQLQHIIEERPEQTLVYETLGHLNEQYPEDFPNAAEHWFNEAVKNNPLSAEAHVARAAFHLRNNQTAKAIPDLEKAEQLDLSSRSVRLRLATEFANADLLDKARSHLAKIQADDPANQALWQIWAIIALDSMSKQEMLQVAQTGLKELAFQPWDFMPLAAELFIRCREFDRAEDCLDKLNQKDIAPATVAFLQGLLAGAKQHNHEAAQSLRKAIQLGNTSEQVQLGLAAALSRTGDQQSALLQLRTLVSQNPRSLRAHLSLAKLLYRTGNWTQTDKHARLAMQIAPNDLDSILLHVRATMQLTESADAPTNTPTWQRVEKQLAKLEDLTGGATEVRLLQLQLAMQRKQFLKAERLLRELRTDENTGIEVSIAEVDLLTAQGKVDQAISRLCSLTEQFPKTVLPTRYLATMLAGHSRRNDCEKLLNDAIKRIESPVAKRDLGLLLAHFYDQWDQHDRSYKLLRALSHELPYDIPIKRRLLKYEQIREDLTKAQQLVDDIKAIEGDQGWQWRFEQANIWFAGVNFENRYPQIVALLKENLVANQDDQTSRMLLAASYEKAGQLRLASATYREAIEHSPDDIRIIISAVAAMYKVKEYEQADQILRQAEMRKIQHPELPKLQLQRYLRKGELSSAEMILEDLTTKEPDNSTLHLSLALLKMWQNKFEQAREILNRLKAEQPGSLLATAALVELNIRRKKNREALALCDEMVARLSNAPSHILRGKTYLMLGQIDKAKKDFERAVSIEPDNVQAWISKSTSSRLMGQLKDAVGDLRKALALQPENLQIQKRIISLLLFSGEPDQIKQGLQLLNSALSSNAQDVELRLYKAHTLLAKGTAPAIRQAQDILQRITEEQPKIVNAWATLAQIHLRQGQFAEAMDTVLCGLTFSPDDKALLLLKAQTEAARAPALAIPTLYVLNEREPNDTEIALRLADTYIAAGHRDKGITLLENLLTSCPINEYRKIDTALAVALHKAGNKAEAERKFDTLYQSAPEEAKIFLAQAQLLKDDGNWDALIEGINERFRCNHDDIDEFLTLAGELAATKGNTARRIAEDLLRRTLDCDPNHIPAMKILAMLLQNIDQPAESAELYKRILKFEPEAVVALNNLAWILCEEQDKYQQALELAQQGLRKAPDYVDLIDTRGVIYYRLGEYQKAVEDFTRCVELYPRNSPSLTASYFHLARALAALGQTDKAVSRLHKTMDLCNEIGGLSPQEVAEAQSLITDLSQKESRVPITN